MAELKTKPTKRSVEAFVNAIPDDDRQRDCRTIMRLMKRITKAQARMWGPGIVGFGSYHYKYESGREGDWFLTGFSPRKHELTIYIMAGFSRYPALLAKLGKYKTGKSCLYIKQLADVDMGVLADLIEQSVTYVKRSAP